MKAFQARIFLAISASVLLGCERAPSQTVTHAAQEPLAQALVLPLPTEHFLDEDAERRHSEQRRAWRESLHRAAPDVDWRAIEVENGLREERRRGELALAALSSGSHPLQGGPWSEVGSANQAGRMLSAALGPDQQTLYAGSALGGLWRGDLNGSGWSPLSDNLYGGVAGVLALPGELPGDPDVLFVHLGGTSLRVTRNLGQLWETPTGITNMSSVRGLALLEDAVHTILVLVQTTVLGNSPALYASTDFGRTFSKRWQSSSNGTASMWIPRRGAAAATHVYLARGNSLLLSTNAGASFSQVGTIAPAGSSVSDVRLTGSEAGAPRLYAMAKIGSSWGLHASFDAGASFAQVHTPSDYWGALCASSVNPNVVMYGGVEAWYSANSGNNFSKINPWGAYYSAPATKLHADIMNITLWAHPTNNQSEIWFISTDGGVYKSTAQGLSPLNLSLSGLGVSQYYSTLTSSSNASLILAGSQDQGYQRGTYLPPTGGGPSTPFAQLISGDYGHMTSSNGTHDLVYSVYPGFVLIQEGQDNPQLLNPFTSFPSGSNHSWLPPILADPIDSQSFFFCADRLYRYTRVSGPTWNYVPHSTQVFSGGGASYLSALAFAATDSQRAFAATDNGKLYYSTDRGVTWTPSSSSAPSQHYFYGSAIAVHPSNPMQAVVGGSGYSTSAVVRTQDGGVSWSPLVAGLPQTLVYDLVYAGNGSGDIYAATEAGAWRFDASAGTWTNIMTTAAPLTLFWSVERVGPNVIRFGTYGRGIWDFEIPAAPGYAKYGTAKLSSLGTLPSIGGQGTPTWSANNFQITVAQGIPSQFGLLAYSSGSGSFPFFGGTMWLQPPVERGPGFTFDGIGSAAVPIAVDLKLIGTARYYQAWMRDPAHPDGTGVGLSDALSVQFGL
jgi:photosystem II stability/assembly factor-like uncharacterized protein